MLLFRILPLLCLLICPLNIVVAQSTSSPTAQGYTLDGNKITFVFNEKDYGISETPNRVVVTGGFRDWSQDMDDAKWQLTFVQSGIWELSFDNSEFAIIKPATPFKFRINEGEWLSPPAMATNEQGGNLVFMSNIKPTKLIAEINATNTIWVQLSGDEVNRSNKAEDWLLEKFDGTVIPIEEILPNTSDEALLKPHSSFDKNRVHYLTYKPLNLRVLCRFDGYYRTLYSSKELGANVASDKKSTSFRLFAPRAEGVKLYLYDNKDEVTAKQTLAMQRDADGVWEATINKDLVKTWYDFTVHGPADEPGSHYFEQTGTHVSDPYARVNDDAFGKSRVWYKGVPAKALSNGIPAMQDVIAYEVHVQDFTDLLPVEEKYKGTFPAMIKSGLKNSNGKPIGFDHLVDLGINVVHLMPVQEYLHYKNEEWQAAFKDDPFMQEQAIAMENYQWGYRITHAMAVENRFREKGTEHGTERAQLTALVDAFHQKGMAVIVDYVFNHTGENMDGRHYNMNFNGIEKSYYYRLDEQGKHIGAFGNETKSENRPMMQRWIIDQCKYFIDEIGVDGFRIDLAGQTDEQTLIKLRDAIGHDKIVYGEPWIGSNDPEFEANPSWDWYKIDSPITFFQDESRNAFKGPPSNPTNKQKDRGYAGGFTEAREDVMLGLANNYVEEPTPNAGINYLDIHDNWALADRFGTTNWDGRKGVDEDRFKIATTLLFTSAGPIVLHGGTEFMRSKALAEVKEQIKKTASGSLYFHGKNDSYNLRAANRFVWENIGSADTNAPNYENMLNWWKGIIEFRNSDYGKNMRIGEAIPENHYRFFAPEENQALLAYTIGNEVFVALNVGEENATIQVNLPTGNWTKIATNEAVDMDGFDTLVIKGNTSMQESIIKLPKTSLQIWVKQLK
jgi:pullulanase/glycogen debranching enzyme